MSEQPVLLAYCESCQEYFDKENSLMGDEGQCQDCWEQEASQGWWQMVGELRGIMQKSMNTIDERRWLEFWFGHSEKAKSLLPVTICGASYDSRQSLEKRLEELRK